MCGTALLITLIFGRKVLCWGDDHNTVGKKPIHLYETAAASKGPFQDADPSGGGIS